MAKPTLQLRNTLKQRRLTALTWPHLLYMKPHYISKNQRKQKILGIDYNNLKTNFFDIERLPPSTP